MFRVTIVSCENGYIVSDDVGEAHLVGKRWVAHTEEGLASLIESLATQAKRESEKQDTSEGAR